MPRRRRRRGGGPAPDGAAEAEGEVEVGLGEVVVEAREGAAAEGAEDAHPPARREGPVAVAAEVLEVEAAKEEKNEQ